MTAVGGDNRSGERPPESAGGVNKVFTAHSNLNIPRPGASHMPPRYIGVVWTRLEDSRRLSWSCIRFTLRMMYFIAVGGEEIFIPYRKSFRIGSGMVDEERSGWGVWRKHFYRDMG